MRISHLVLVTTCKVGGRTGRGKQPNLTKDSEIQRMYLRTCCVTLKLWKSEITHDQSVVHFLNLKTFKIKIISEIITLLEIHFQTMIILQITSFINSQNIKCNAFYHHKKCFLITMDSTGWAESFVVFRRNGPQLAGGGAHWGLILPLGNTSIYFPQG